MKKMILILAFTLPCFSQTDHFNNVQADGTLKVSGGTNSQSYNGVLQANPFATGGAGTSVSPWTSASGTGGIGEAITAAGVADGGNARIHVPPGFYSVTTCINATANVTTAQGNSAPPTPLIIQGDGPGKTVLVAGTGGCVFDTTGRAVSIKELTIVPAVSTPSVLGILQGRATNAASSFTPNNIFEHLVISLGTVPAANGGNGTIGIYNLDSEGNWYHQNTVTADHPMVLTSNNIFSIASTYQTQNTTLRFISENRIEEGSLSSAGLTAGEAILLQGHAANTKIIGVAGECNGGSPSPVFLRIKAPTAPDSASDPLAGLVVENSQAECTTGGQLIVDEQILSDAKIHGAFKNLVNVPVILLTTAAAQLVDPLIDLQLGNGGVSTPLVSDGGVATGGILGGIIMLPATGTIAFTNASTACNGVHVYASYASPSITCNNAAGYGVGGTLIGEMWATDQYYFKGTGANNYNSNTSHAWNVAGNQILFCSAVFCSVNIQAAFLSHLNISEIASPGPGAGGTTRIYADSTAHNLQASYNGDALSKLMRSSDLAAPPAIGGTTPAAGSFTILNGTSINTKTNCAAVGTAASPSVAACGSAAAGHFSCATNATGATCTVNTSAVTANSEIFVFESDTTVTGTALGVTCNTSTTVNPATRLLASSVAATSFTINLGTVTTNPACFSYFIVN